MLLETGHGAILVNIRPDMFHGRICNLHSILDSIPEAISGSRPASSIVGEEDRLVPDLSTLVLLFEAIFSIEALIGPVYGVSWVLD